MQIHHITCVNSVSIGKTKADELFQDAGLRLPGVETIIGFNDSIAYSTEKNKYPAKTNERNVNMENIYPITLKIEVLREMSAGIKGDLFRYFYKNNISTKDRSEPLVILYWKIAEIGNSLLDNVYKTVDDLDEVASQLKFVKEYVSELV